MSVGGEAPPDTGSEISEDLHRHLVESISAVTYVLPLGRDDEPPLYVSPQCEAVLGLPREALMVDAAARLELVHSDDRARVAERATLMAATDHWDEEYRMVLPDGSVRWIHDQARLVPGNDDRATVWFGILTDVTRANEAERALADSETKYRALVEEIPAVVYIDSCDERPVSLYVSPQSERLSGYRPEEWIADPELWLRVVHPDDRHLMSADWPPGVGDRDELTQEYRLIHRDGHVVWFRDSARLIRAEDGTPLFWQGVAIDVTEQRVNEQRVRDSEARYRALVEDIPAIVYIATDEPQPTTTYMSPQTLEFIGYAPEEWNSDQDLWWNMMHPDDRSMVRSLWESAVERHEPFVSEYRATRRDGTEVWLRDVAHLVRPAAGEPLFWQGVIQDVTDEKRAEQVLRASEMRYRLLVEQVPAVVYEMGLDDERRTLFVSPQVEALFGYSREEWLDQPDIWTELLHPDDRELELAAHDLHNETGEPWSQEYRLIASDGRVVWVRDQARLVRDEMGRASTWQGVMLDITAQKDLEERLRQTNDQLELRVLQRTADLEEANEMMTLEIGERKRAEADLREARERYRRLVEDIPAVVYIWQTGNLESEQQYYTSPRIEQLLGFTAEEWNKADTWIERLHPHDRDRVLAATARSEATGEPFSEEYRLLAKDGRLVWLLDHATMLSRDDQGRPLLFQGVLMDMTVRHRAEELAARAEQRHRELAEQGPVVFYVYEHDADREQPVALEYVSPQIQDITGYPAARLKANPMEWFDMLHPDDRAWVLEDAQRTWNQGQPWNRDLRLIAEDGRIVWVHQEGRVIERDDQGRPRRLQGILLDITARKEDEERLREDEARLRSFVEQFPGVPWTKVIEDPTMWRPTFMGPQVEALLGYTPEELMAEPRYFARILHPDDRDRVLALAARSARASREWFAEYRVIARDGRVVWLRSMGNPGRDEQGRPVMHGIWLDITQERERADAVTTIPETARLDP